MILSLLLLHLLEKQNLLFLLEKNLIRHPKKSKLKYFFGFKSCFYFSNLNPPKSHVITLDNHLLDNSIITKANKLKTTSKKSNKRKIEEENETEVIQINTENSPNLKKDKSPTNILSRSSAKSPSNSPAKSPSKFPKSSPKSSSSKEEQAASGITIVITKKKEEKKEKRPSKKAKTLKDALDYTISKVTQWNKKAYSNDKILLESCKKLKNFLKLFFNIFYFNF